MNIPAIGLLAMLALSCAPVFKPATLSTMAPKTRLVLTDSTRLDVKQPEVRHDTLYSQAHPPIPTDSISRVEVNEGEGGTSAGTIVGIVLGISLGSWLAAQGGN